MSDRDELMSGIASVWTDENRSRYDRRGHRYPSDFTNEEWLTLEPLLPVAKGTGRPRIYMLLEVMNGTRYVQRYGIPWDATPKDLPPGSICYEREGVSLVALYSEDAPGHRARVEAQGIPCQGCVDFRRRVKVPGKGWDEAVVTLEILVDPA